jgi:3-hydroxybutyrate dehydrogenase
MFLKGKTAIVTGSTSGIGLAYAQALAAEGAAVMINGFGDADAIERERAELSALSGTEARYSAADMSKPDAIAAMVKECADTLGGPDIVISNAGIQHVAPVDEFPI